MKLLSRLKENFPPKTSILLTTLSAVLLNLAFPGFELWFLAWFALVPLFLTISKEKNSILASFISGWIFGIVFFFGSCWWLTYAPITYADFPVLLAYFLLLCATLIIGLFFAVFAGLFSILLKRFGDYAIFSAPFLWTAIEFSRFWITGNNWNEIAYSHAFSPSMISFASYGGIYLVGFIILLINSIFTFEIRTLYFRKKFSPSDLLLIFPVLFLATFLYRTSPTELSKYDKTAKVVAVQPNVPMGGLTDEKWSVLKKRHIELAENALLKIKERNAFPEQQTVVIFPESPMNFMYESDLEFQKFIGDFARKNNVSVLFNSAEPDAENKTFFNSAVMVNGDGRKIAQYDKIYLVPFGESVPAPLQNFMPALVGSFSFGKEYDLLPFGEAKGGVMICFESHFPNLSREYAKEGADVLIEMTNDGYLGNTPVLRQHLANAVFRAVETSRPVLRVTNVGITAYINERGAISDAADVYAEATRTWTITKSNGEQTFYVRYGDWFAWLCIILSLGLLIWSIFLTQNRKNTKAQSF